MEYDWVADQILNHELSDAVTAIVARGKDDIIDALWEAGWSMLPCGHHPDYADDKDGKAICRACDGEVRYIAVTIQNRELCKALKAISNHGTGLAKVVAQLALKELDRA
jgi:hypothetical protein